MEGKEFRISIPKGYEIDKENSTFECIKFKPIKHFLKYEELFDPQWEGYYINYDGYIEHRSYLNDATKWKNVASNKNQLDRVLALNQLFNITEYYNKGINPPTFKYKITYCKNLYFVYMEEDDDVYNITPAFYRREDAQAVINNPNFRPILDLVYKGTCV